MRRLGAALVGLVAVLVTSCSPAAPAPSSATASPSTFTPSATFEADRPTFREGMILGRRMKYCGNGSLADAARAERVVVVLHGIGRSACDEAAAVMFGAKDRVRTTLVIAPRFATSDDPASANEGMWRWQGFGWIQGDAALEGGPSSYAVVDDLVGRAGSRPVVVAGFSGGGQFVARYSAATIKPIRRFIVADPSTYLYWTPERPATPASQLAACPNYNHYRYGLEGLNPYMAAIGAATLRSRFAAAPIAYLLGDSDNDPRSPSLDRSCAAEAQGPDRVVRGMRYFEYLRSVFGDDIYTRQRLVHVPGAVHVPAQVLGSPQAAAEIFA